MAVAAAAGRTNLRLLDCGCGTGANLALLRRHGRAFGFDLTARGLAFAAAQGETTVARASIAAIPFPDAAFDVVTSFDVFYGLPDEIARASAREMARVLRPGGMLLVTTAAFEHLRGGHGDLHQRGAPPHRGEPVGAAPRRRPGDGPGVLHPRHALPDHRDGARLGALAGRRHRRVERRRPRGPGRARERRAVGRARRGVRRCCAGRPAVWQHRHGAGAEAAMTDDAASDAAGAMRDWRPGRGVGLGIGGHPGGTSPNCRARVATLPGSLAGRGVVAAAAAGASRRAARLAGAARAPGSPVAAVAARAACPLPS